MASLFSRTPSNKPLDSAVTVIGLGRFGLALAAELTSYGVEVFGIDDDDKLIKDQPTACTDFAVADTTDRQALKQLGVDEAHCVVIGIGSDLEASILTASNVVEFGVPNIWAKAVSDAHARILKQIGVHHVVRPERDTGRRVAHLLGERFEDFAEVDADFGMIKMVAPQGLCDRVIDVQRLWEKCQVHIVAVKSPDGSWHPFTAGQRLSAADLIVISGSPMRLEEFSQRPMV